MFDLAAERAYPTPFATNPLLPLLLLSLATQKHTPKTVSKFKEEYDYIIVGGGSAGSVVASRLSEIPCVSVLLIEAGKPPPLLTDVPVTARSYWFSDIDWAYKTVPQRNAGFGLINNQVIWPSGKVLGGSSILNEMLYVRGNHKNYDDWARNGAVGWSYSDVRPYFLKLEDNRDPAYLSNGYHAVDGPITVQTPSYNPDLKMAVMEAAKQIGHKVVDPNGRRQTGFYVSQINSRNGQRCSSAKGYLVPAENRTNLDIVTKAFVKKVIIENKRASGVKFDFDGKSFHVRAKREVILSAGTMNTAQLLMLSGIGPRKHLEDLKIPVVADLPVGENLQDHSSTPLIFELDPSILSITQKYSNPEAFDEYLDNRTGPFSNAVPVVSFLNGEEDPPSDFPNFHMVFAEISVLLFKDQLGLKPEVYEEMYAPYENKTVYTCLIQSLQPKTRGTVKLRSSNPYDPPLIDPNYYGDSSDFQAIVQGLKECLKIGRSEPMQKLGAKPLPTLNPGCKHLSEDLDAYLECTARSVVVTLNHQVGVAKMGDPRDPTTVVDPKLRVKGIKGLRCIDASVMPIIPSGNTNIPTIMVAEKASDILKSTIDCYAQTPVKSPNDNPGSPYYNKPPKSPNAII